MHEALGLRNAECKCNISFALYRHTLQERMQRSSQYSRGSSAFWFERDGGENHYAKTTKSPWLSLRNEYTVAGRKKEYGNAKLL